MSTFGAVAMFPLLAPRDRLGTRTGHQIPAAGCVSGLATNRSRRKRTIDPVRLLCPPCAQNDCRLGETLEAFAPWPAPLTTVRGSAAQGGHQIGAEELAVDHRGLQPDHDFCSLQFCLLRSQTSS